jgi:hypothetical protein
VNSIDEWAEIIEIVDGIEALKPERTYQKKRILNTSSTRHMDGHGGNYVRPKSPVVIEMNVKTLALWKEFQEKVESEPDKSESEAMRDDELFGVDSIFVSSKVLKPWNELTKKRKTQFGRDFKKPFEDFLLAYMPNIQRKKRFQLWMNYSQSRRQNLILPRSYQQRCRLPTKEKIRQQ